MSFKLGFNGPKRKEILLHRNWKFCIGNEDDNFWKKGFDDSNWQDISVPHDWAVGFAFSRRYSSGTGYLPGGTGYYRKKFYLPAEDAGKKVLIRFDGVYKRCQVWCNGHNLGGHAFGYGEFFIDVGGVARFGGEANELAVKVNHEDYADSRWYTGSGIYRKVTVIITDNIFIPPYGVIVTSKILGNGEKAEVLARVAIQNETGANAEVTLKQTLISQNGEAVTSAETAKDVPAGSTEVSQVLSIINPSLWSVENPALYKLQTEIFRGGEKIDDVFTIIGVREILFDADKGFFLNGLNTKIKGVCFHHDAGRLGAAVYKKVWERRLRKLKAMGANAVRCAHNPHMPELYDLCDEMGFLVMDEAFDEWESPKNKWTRGHNVYPPRYFGYSEDFHQNCEEDLSAMVKRDRNHPSVILWSIGNEIDYPNDPYCHPLFKTIDNNVAGKPSDERIYDPNKPNAERLTAIAKKLYDVVKRCDDSRLITSALAFPELSNAIGFADVLDAVGYNYKEHLYKEDHKKYPNRIITGAENGKDIAQWLSVMENDFIAGQFLWAGADFLGETVGWPCRGSEVGLLDTAGFEKPVYYHRQSLWQNKPELKIFTFRLEDISPGESLVYSNAASRCWNYAEGDSVGVICFTNASEPRLYINGEPTPAGERNSEGFFYWQIPFAAGELKCSAPGWPDDVLRGAGRAVSLVAASKETRISVDGLELAHVIIEATDNNGALDARCDARVEIETDGPGVILAIENGDLWDSSDCSKNSRRMKNGRALVYAASSGERGKFTVTAKARGMKSAAIVIESV